LITSVAQNVGIRSAEEILDGFEQHLRVKMGKEITQENVAEGIDRFINLTFAEMAASIFAGVKKIRDTLVSQEDVAALGEALRPILDYIDLPLVRRFAALEKESLYTRQEVLDIQAQQIRELIEGFDGSLYMTQQLSTAITDRYTLELQYLAAIRQAAEQINQTAQNARDTITLGGLDDRGRYDFYRNRYDEEIEKIKTATTPEQVTQATDRAISALLAAFNTLPESMQNLLRPQFLQSITDTETLADARLAELESTLTQSSADLQTAVASLVVGQEQVRAQTEALRDSTDNMRVATTEMRGATDNLRQSIVNNSRQTTVTVNNQSELA
jgi:hypothetical protein